MSHLYILGILGSNSNSVSCFFLFKLFEHNYSNVTEKCSGAALPIVAVA